MTTHGDQGGLGMSDATRWFVEGGIVYRLDPDEAPGRGYVAESDHLAALERVRVETYARLDRMVVAALQEARAVVADRAGRSYEGLAWIGRQGTLAAIDCLIDATTTGATDA